MKLLILILLFTSTVFAKNYNQNKETIKFIKMMVKEHNYKPSYLKKLFSDVTKQDTPLNIVSRKKVKLKKNLFFIN